MKVYNMGHNYPASFENGYFKVDDTQLNAPDKDDFEKCIEIRELQSKLYEQPKPKRRVKASV